VGVQGKAHRKLFTKMQAGVNYPGQLKNRYPDTRCSLPISDEVIYPDAGAYYPTPGVDFPAPEKNIFPDAEVHCTAKKKLPSYRCRT